jgi:hypothetical protein
MRRRADGAPSWSARTLAVDAQTSASTVWRIWKRYALGPEATTGEVARALAQLISETEENP